MSPIFIRPAREQDQHDRLIRVLEAKYKRKFTVAINPGDEHTAPVKLGANTYFPDLVLMAGKKLAGMVEVETGESVNNLEAMAQWVPFSRARVFFHLYVPVPSYETTRRLADANDVRVGEIWTYRTTLEGFDMVRMHHDPAAATARPPAARAGAARGSRKPARKPAPKPARRTAAPAARRGATAARRKPAAAKRAPARPRKAAPRRKRR